MGPDFLRQTSIAYNLFITAIVLSTIVALILSLRSALAKRKVWLSIERVHRQRIAAAFGIEKTKGYQGVSGWAGRAKIHHLELHWIFDVDDNWRILGLYLDTKGGYWDTCISYDRSEKKYRVGVAEGKSGGELMARAAYRLGFDEAVLAQLPQPTAHEKLELRLSMPRELWPQKWLDEEGG